jgi:capsular polysaccharide biosynthesis protein
MELTEAARRILLGHWLVIAVCIAGGLGVALALHREDTPKYVATTRLVLDAHDPQAIAEATSLYDSARAIVTSPSHVSAALARVGASRDATVLAAQDVSLQGMGSSNVMQLTVRDRDPKVASGLANALADDLIQTRLAIDSGALESQVKDVQAKLDETDKQIAQLLNQAGGNGGAAQAQLTPLQNQRNNLAQEKQTLVGQRDARPNPLIVDPAVPPSRPEPTRLPLDLALGVLLGVVAGLGVAAIREAAWPTISGPKALVRTADAPTLGHLSEGARTASFVDCAPVSRLLRLAAVSSGATGILLVPVGPPVQLAKLAWQLGRQATDGDQGSISVYDEPPGRDISRWNTRIVLVTPTKLRRSDFESVQELLVRAKWAPVLGLITYSPGQWSRGRIWRWPHLRHRRQRQLAAVGQMLGNKPSGLLHEPDTGVGE